MDQGLEMPSSCRRTLQNLEGRRVLGLTTAAPSPEVRGWVRAGVNTLFLKDLQRNSAASALLMSEAFTGSPKNLS